MPFTSSLRLAVVLAAFALAAKAAAQCTDPPAPRGGFPMMSEIDKTIVFSDGYKTKADLLMPSVAPGPCGWPLLVYVHPVNGNRKVTSAEPSILAAQGFAVLLYDVRAQGDARTLNPGIGSQLWAVDEWVDLAETIEWAVSTYPGKIDATRLGVLGDSQGGLHAWAAAAWSGKVLPGTSRRTKPFPVITAVAPRFFSPDQVGVLVPDGTSFFLHVPGFAYEAQHPFALIDANYRAQLAGFLDRDDPQGLTTFLRGVPGKDFLAELKSSRVAVFAVQGSLDPWADAGPIQAALASMPATTPKRLYISTGVHGMPGNVDQTLRMLLLTETWFRRHLKGDSDPVERGPAFETALLPPDPATYADVSSLWRHRMDSEMPPARSSLSRLYLRRDAVLSATPPAASEGDAWVSQYVTFGYDARAFTKDSGSVTLVQTKIPMSSVVFTSTPLAGDLEVTGSPTASLYVTPDNRSFLVAARLLVVSPSDQVQVIATGALGVRQQFGPGPQRVDLKLTLGGCVVPEGSRLRLEVRNQDVQRPGTADIFRRIPLFHSFSVRVAHNAGTPSWIDIPVRPRVEADIATGAKTIVLDQPGRQDLEIRSSAACKNALYVVLLGFSGQGPPVPFPDGSKLWLVPDQVSTLLLQAVNTPFLPGFAGLLDASGSASCAIDFGPLAPLPLSLAGSFLVAAPTFLLPATGVNAGASVRLRFL